MSRLVAFAAIQGGYKVVSQVEGELEKLLQTYDADTKIGFQIPLITCRLSIP
jgi:acetyl-CoA synthase